MVMIIWVNSTKQHALSITTTKLAGVQQVAVSFTFPLYYWQFPSLSRSFLHSPLVILAGLLVLLAVSFPLVAARYINSKITVLYLACGLQVTQSIGHCCTPIIQSEYGTHEVNRAVGPAAPLTSKKVWAPYHTVPLEWTHQGGGKLQMKARQTSVRTFVSCCLL